MNNEFYDTFTQQLLYFYSLFTFAVLKFVNLPTKYFVKIKGKRKIIDKTTFVYLVLRYVDI